MTYSCRHHSLHFLLTTLLLLLFFFYGSADHRDLHSFPTRRSSDLTRIRGPRERPLVVPLAGRPASAGRRRSEEHTSELQSLRHLVCRLLLEKKKKTKANPFTITFTDVVPSRKGQRHTRAVARSSGL